MRKLSWIVLALSTFLGRVSAQHMAPDDAVRVREFFRLAAQIQDQIWQGWSRTPAPLLLVTSDGEFLTHHPAPPKDFKQIGNDLYVRPRHFPTNLLATFPAFGPPSVIVIGEPANTSSKTSTPWIFTLMHEHFHQLQSVQPGYFEGVQNLGLTHGDQTGMWMLNYPFPYDAPAVVQGFLSLRELLLAALKETDPAKFAATTRRYVEARKVFYPQLSPDDHKYLAFQLWQEGIARYTDIRAAEEAVNYKPSAEFSALADYEPFAQYAASARRHTLDELQNADLAVMKREVVYSWGAAEGFLLDRLQPKWRDTYFRHPFSLDSYFK